MKYTVYKTTNLINGKIYIGKHQTEDPNDDYMGSGVKLKLAFQKYGRENFKKEVLYVFDTLEEMDDKEKEIIDESFVLRKDTYNVGIGGEGGAHFKGKNHSAETKKRLAKHSENRVFSEQTRKKISEANRKRVFSEETKRKISEKSKEREAKKRINRPTKVKEKYVMTPEHKERIANSLRKKGALNENVKTEVKCPHCEKVGQKLAMSRYHFDKCKMLRGGLVSQPVS